MAEDQQDQQPLLRVVRGDATPEEVAALVAVIASLAGAAESPSKPVSEWSEHHRKSRVSLPHGPGGWRWLCLDHVREFNNRYNWFDGMTADEMENLFTRFYRAKNDTTTRITGTGLGLYLTRYFIEAHGGSVEVSSEPGQGSVFKIYLPVHQKSAQPQPGLKREKPFLKLTRFKKKEN